MGPTNPRLTGALAAVIVAVLASGAGGLAAGAGHHVAHHRSDAARLLPSARAESTTLAPTTSTAPSTVPVRAPTTLPPVTTTTPSTTTTSRTVPPTTTTTPAKRFVVLTIPTPPTSSPSVTVPAGEDLEVRVYAGQTPDANDLGDANPAILQRAALPGCATPTCLAFRTLATGQTRIIFAGPHSCGLPGEAACPPGEVTIPLVVMVRVSAAA